MIWACGRKAIQYSKRQAASGFVWAKLSGIFVYSCYASPSLTLPEFEELLDDRKGGTGSIVDLTFVSPALARDMSWKVSEDFT